MGGAVAALGSAAGAIGSGVKSAALDTKDVAMHNLFGTTPNPRGYDPNMSHTAAGAPTATPGVVGAAPSTVQNPVTAGLPNNPDTSSPFRTRFGSTVDALYGNDQRPSGPTSAQMLRRNLSPN